MFSCKHCELGFKSESGRRKHIQSIHLRIRYPCKICGVELMQNENLENHMRRHLDERPFKCDQCNKSYVSMKDILRHKLTHDKSLEKRFKCDTCSKVFYDNSRLKRHVKLHTGKNLTHKCEVCSRAFGSSSHLKRHLLVHTNERKYPCPHNECNFKFKTSSDLKEHSITHQNNWQRLKCQYCDKTLLNKHSLQHHYNRLHNPNRSKLVCVFCSKTFGSRGNLVQHILCHIKEKPYNCELCDAEFMALAQRNLHIRRFHTLERPYSCDICDYRSLTNVDLKLHKQVHKNGKKY